MSSTAIVGTGLLNPHQIFINAPNFNNVATCGTTGVIINPPPGAALLKLSGNLDFYVSWGSSGASTVASTAGAASEYVPYTGGPIYRKISTQGTTMISFASSAACVVGQTWWCI